MFGSACDRAKQVRERRRRGIAQRKFVRVCCTLYSWRVEPDPHLKSARRNGPGRRSGSKRTSAGPTPRRVVLPPPPGPATKIPTSPGSVQDRNPPLGVRWIPWKKRNSAAAVSPVARFDDAGWTEGLRDSRNVTAALEAGDVLFFPTLAFSIEPQEHQVFSPAIVGAAKNVSYDPRTGRLGAAADGSAASRLRELIARFSDAAARMTSALFPDYRDRLEKGRASFRPVEIAGRATSWRKDDTRLHIDSFPATPVHGRRILRLFSNVNPAGQPRSWRIGEDFEGMAARFAMRLRMPAPGSAAVLRLLRVTKALRSPYDALMLQLHDCMKADAEYQAGAPQTRVDFPPGSTWIAFTDQVSHAAMAGQYQLEQTFLLPVDAMRDEQRSPLKILERLLKRRLV
jgi:hypothetical protein